MKVYINTVFDELYSQDARQVVLPGDEGELSIMDFHQPVICRLIEGNIKIISRLSARQARQKEDLIRIKDGVAHMEGNALKIMAEV